ncbi:F-box only protein 43 [Phascolarctos cinereus]|uniref:F-box only protein 43 n=1 Tax=Phascolarctos cinereus TaxID=38626 RepID=A0A6P5IVA6_PHACI|nr:F-box only protein 43 [Phascolarctos cinereus]
MSDSPSVKASVTLRNGVESPNVSFKSSSFCSLSSTSSFQDSGYSDSLKASSFDYSDVENIGKNMKGLSSTQEYSENSSLGFTCSVDSPTENKNSSSFFRKEVNEVTELCETPKVTRKKTFFRRRLNITNIISREDTEHFDKQNCSLGSCAKALPMSQLLSFEERVSKRALGSPRQTIFVPVATSTLKADEATSNGQKLRLSFSQHKTSTIDDSKSDRSLFEVECISPIQGNSCTDALTNDFGDSILSINGETTGPELLGSSSCEALCETKEDVFVTPISNLVANIKFCGYSPAEGIDNISTPEDSGFNSLGLDKSQDSFSDHEGSFQELFQKPLGTERTLGTKRKPKNVGRVRRLSTLRERSSQSETEEDKPFVNSGFKAKIAAASGVSPSEQIDNNSGDSILGLKDLSKTPALQLVHEIIMKSKRKRFQQTGVRSRLKNVEGGEVSLLEYVIAGLIGKKMGLEKLDILTELKFRNLKHILAIVLDALTVENLCSVWRVSKNWREIVVQDKKANQRRKDYIQELKADSRGSILCVEDAATRLSLLNRSALRSVQAQARTPGSQKEEVSTPSPWGQVLTPKECCSVTQLPSKQEEYVKVAKTLFIDEALKPCPRCQSPAKYQPVKKRGLCSREACGFDFCVLCLCTYHGAEECSSRSAKPRNRRDALPGSAQSKRNLRRL